jgi:protein-tyrosine phosphatase
MASGRARDIDAAIAQIAAARPQIVLGDQHRTNIRAALTVPASGALDQ